MASETPVDELEGRALDAAVSKEVLGVCILEGCGRFPSYVFVGPPESDQTRMRCATCGRPVPYRTGARAPRYSEDIAAVWQVVEHLRETTKYNVIVSTPTVQSNPIYEWDCVFTSPIPEGNRSASGSSAPEAICRAALRAVRTSPD